MEFGMNATHRGGGMGIRKGSTSFASFMRVAGAVSFLLAAGFATAGGANPQTQQTETGKAAGMPQIENGKVEQREVKAGVRGPGGGGSGRRRQDWADSRAF